jgi:hypothetical protein
LIPDIKLDHSVDLLQPIGHNRHFLTEMKQKKDGCVRRAWIYNGPNGREEYPIDSHGRLVKYAKDVSSVSHTRAVRTGVQAPRPNESYGSPDSLPASSGPDDFFWSVADLGDVPLFDGGLLLTGPEDQSKGVMLEDVQLGSVPDMREFEDDSQRLTFSW